MERINIYECTDCGNQYEGIYDEGCPECGGYSHRISSYGICECGAMVYLDGNTNICDCGRIYNAFGQELADPSEWDDEDRYACFGPQNYRNDWY